MGDSHSPHPEIVPKGFKSPFPSSEQSWVTPHTTSDLFLLSWLLGVSVGTGLARGGGVGGKVRGLRRWGALLWAPAGLLLPQAVQAGAH